MNEGLAHHILIVDDSETERQLLQKLLELNAYRVSLAGNGVEALASARRNPPDAIVSDVAMPKMDGFTLCHTWMRDPDLLTVPFIFYSANLTLAQDAHVGKALGAARYLTKPMGQDEFLKELRSVLEG
ncbi:MAG: response regulator [Burkholderiales bacterium]|nr:response regulator [Burkholderiales bacterium]